MEELEITLTTTHQWWAVGIASVIAWYVLAALIVRKFGDVTAVGNEVHTIQMRWRPVHVFHCWLMSPAILPVAAVFYGGQPLWCLAGKCLYTFSTVCLNAKDDATKNA